MRNARALATVALLVGSPGFSESDETPGEHHSVVKPRTIPVDARETGYRIHRQVTLILSSTTAFDLGSP